MIREGVRPRGEEMTQGDVAEEEAVAFGRVVWQTRVERSSRRVVTK